MELKVGMTKDTESKYETMESAKRLKDGITEEARKSKAETMEEVTWLKDEIMEGLMKLKPGITGEAMRLKAGTTAEEVAVVDVEEEVLFCHSYSEHSFWQPGFSICRWQIHHNS